MNFILRNINKIVFITNNLLVIPDSTTSDDHKPKQQKATFVLPPWPADLLSREWRFLLLLSQLLLSVCSTPPSCRKNRSFVEAVNTLAKKRTRTTAATMPFCWPVVVFVCVGPRSLVCVAHGVPRDSFYANICQ